MMPELEDAETHEKFAHAADALAEVSEHEIDAGDESAVHEMHMRLTSLADKYG